MAITNFNDLPNIGNITDGDKLLGERVDGTTVRIVFNGVLYDTDFATNGLMARTGAGTYADRTLTGTSGRLTITNGDGAAGNPTFDISSSYVGQSTITTLGSITTGVWNGSILGTTYGGTGANITPSNGGIIYSNATTLAVLAATATANKLLVSGSSGAPSWSTPTFPNASATSRKLIVSDGTNWVASTETYAVPGTANNYMKSDGTNWTSVAPTATATASTLAGWDANVNLTSNSFLPKYTTTVTAAGTTTLTVGSTQLQYFTGSTTQTVNLPVASTLVLGQSFTLVNFSSGLVTVFSSGSGLIVQLAANTMVVVTCILTSGTASSSWSYAYQSVNSTGGSSSGLLKSVQVFTSGGTYTRPAGVVSVVVEVQAPGGGGGGVSAATAFAAGGGGGGYGKRYVPTVGSTETVTIGAAGTAGANTGATGGTGGTTSFGTWVSCTGGIGGVGSTSGGTAAGGTGGVGSSGSYNISGGTGWGGGSNLGGGPGGASHFGAVQAPSSIGAGFAGVAYGGGGSGAAASGTAAIGGLGGAGIVVVWEYS